MGISQITETFQEELDKINTLNEDSESYPRQAVALKLVEEMSELTKELMKHFYFGCIRQDEILEETADVILLLDQLIKILPEDSLRKNIEYKINRFKRRNLPRSDV